MKKLAVLAFSILTALPHAGHATVLKTKFESLLGSIESRVSEYETGKTNVDTIAAGDLRQYLFIVQTLAELYTGQYAGMSTVKTSSKSLEDQIGAYRKAVEQLSYAQQAGAAKEKLEHLTRARDDGRDRLVRFFEDSGWKRSQDGEIAKLRGILGSIQWKDDADEKSYAYRALGAQLTRVAETKWDMSRLEGGGIHDLRKEARWYKLELGALDFFIGLQGATCNEGPVRPKDPSSGGKCLVSECLHTRVMNVYDVLGTIKDEGEGQDGVGGHLPEASFKKASDLYEGIKKDRIFENLAQEFVTCELN